jgi:hypothetical protein
MLFLYGYVVSLVADVLYVPVVYDLFGFCTPIL